MKKLLQIEALKTMGYPAFRATILLHAILFLLVSIIASNININIQGVNIEKLFHFPHIWGTFAWISSWFNLLLGIIVIILISNEFQFRTFRKQLIDGLSRNELLVAKILVVLIIAAYTMLLVFLAGLIIGVVKSPVSSFNDLVIGLPILPVLFIQALAYMLLAMLIAFIFRSTALSIVGFILFFFPVEAIVRAFFPDNIDKFFPVKIISNLTPMPDFFGIAFGDMIEIQSQSAPDLYSMGLIEKPIPIFIAVGITLIYSILFILISKLIIKRRNF